MNEIIPKRLKMTHSMKPETKDRVFSSSFLVLILTMALWWSGDAAYARRESIQITIQKAGNADEDAERLKILQQFCKEKGLEKNLQNDLDQLIKQIDRWLLS